MTKEYLVMVDVETTGLDPKDHLLLEIALSVHAATAPFHRVGGDEIFHRVVRVDEEYARSLANDYVKEMHQVTGLWSKLKDGQALPEIDEDLREYLEERIPEGVGRIAGNSVRLDMNFMDAYLPKTMEWLSYRFLDVTGLAWWLHSNFEVPYFEKNRSQVHTAEADLEQCRLELLHTYSYMWGTKSRDTQKKTEFQRLMEIAERATPGPWEKGDRWMIQGSDFCQCKESAGPLVAEVERDINGKRMMAHIHRSEEPWWESGIYSRELEDGKYVRQVISEVPEYGEMSPEDAEFIKTFNPKKIKELLVLLERSGAHHELPREDL